ARRAGRTATQPQRRGGTPRRRGPPRAVTCGRPGRSRRRRRARLPGTARPARRLRAVRARRRARGSRPTRSWRESSRVDTMLAGDLVLVGVRQATVADNLFAADVEPVDAVRPGEHEPAHGIGGATELESVGPPDREVGALTGRQLADVVPSEDRGAAARPESQRIARGQRRGAAPDARDEQRLLDLEEEIAAL